MDKKIASIISLCSRAGKLKSGERACEDALKNGEAFLIIISMDASSNTMKKFKNKAYYYDVPVMVYAEKEELGAVTGNSPKSAVAVTDENFAAMLINELRNTQG